MQSILNQDKIQSFLEAKYWISEPYVPIFVQIKNEILDDFLKFHQAKCWCFITAWNPGAQQVDKKSNKKAQNSLLNDLTTFHVFPGVGASADGLWSEPSFLVLDIEINIARKLALKYGQMAFLYGKIGKPSRIIFTDYF